MKNKFIYKLLNPTYAYYIKKYNVSDQELDSILYIMSLIHKKLDRKNNFNNNELIEINDNLFRELASINNKKYFHVVNDDLIDFIDSNYNNFNNTSLSIIKNDYIKFFRIIEAFINYDKYKNTIYFNNITYLNNHILKYNKSKDLNDLMIKYCEFKKEIIINNKHSYDDMDNMLYVLRITYTYLYLNKELLNNELIYEKIFDLLYNQSFYEEMFINGAFMDTDLSFHENIIIHYIEKMINKVLNNNKKLIK